MRVKSKIIILGSILILILLIGCSLPGAGTLEAADQDQLEPTPTNILEPVQTEAVPTATAPLNPADTPEARPPVPAETTATTGPQCTVLQPLNLRSGPGTAYNPPIRALDVQTILIPQGYNPVGIPGGPWVQVLNESQGEIGWVSAGTQFISCNTDLTSLPSVQVADPPPPPPPNVNSSAPDGTPPENLIWEADFNPQYFFRLWGYADDSEDKVDGDGVDRVIFEVKDEDGIQVYETTEHQAGFCVFGGDEACNPWVIEDYVYKWEPGGEPIKDGNYQLAVRVIMESGQDRSWRYQINLKLQ